MVAIPDFTPTVPDVLPPCSIEAEETLLGGLMLDPGAIDQIKFRLKPEHFYISAHRDIYKACVKLSKKGQPTDLLTVASWLEDNDLLKRTGGRNKLVSLVERCVSTANIDHLASLVAQKALRRELIELGNQTIHLGYATDVEIDEVLSVVRRRTEKIVGLESIQTEEENRANRFNKLIDKLKAIYTKIVEPDYRLYCLQELAHEVSKSTRFLEDIYARHLVKKVVSPLMTYGELKEAAKSSNKEWLHQGLFPKRTTGVLYGSGGILKTKLLYQVCKALIQGKNLGEFSATGEKRKIMIYQGDERESDMASALEIMGYDEGDIGQHIKIRFNWSFEHMPLLIQDLQEFQPDFVIIDSLTYSSRFSSYNENEVAYARPILELTGLANEHNTSFMLVHHANRNGEIRGSSAIFNAVSEVWKIEKDASQFATPNDRLLTIEKSRSRSSGKKYKIIFEPDNLDFVFTGEEDKSEVQNQHDTGCKADILEYLRKSPNVPYTREELVHYVNYSKSVTAKALSLLVCDGLINMRRGSGTRPHTYYISYEGDTDRGGAIPLNLSLASQASQASQIETLAQDASNPLLHKDYSLASQASHQNPETFSENQKLKREKIQDAQDARLEPIPSMDLLASQPPKTKKETLRTLETQENDHFVCYNPPEISQEIPQNSTEVVQQVLIPETDNPPPQRELPPPIKVLEKTCLGEIKTKACDLGDKRWRFSLLGIVDGISDVVVDRKIGNTKPEKALKQVLHEHLRSLTFQVYRADGNNGWVDGCKWEESFDSHDAMRKRHKFTAPDGTYIDVFGFGCDRIRIQ